MTGDMLVAIGEALIDFIPSVKGGEFDEVDSFLPATGGAPANVAGAYAALGGRSVLLTKLGNDPFGNKIIKELGNAGIDTSYILQTDEANTALAFVSLAPDGNRTFFFYRNPSADMLYRGSEVPAEAFEGIFALHFCSVSLGDFPMKEAHIKAIEYAKASGALISFDPNLRFMLWDDHDKLSETVDDFLQYADIVKISDDELLFITGKDNITDALPYLWNKGVRLVLFTRGSDGMSAYTGKAEASVEAPEAEAVDTTGAGDASIGSFLWKLNSMGYGAGNIEDITSPDLKRILGFSAAFCAESIKHKGAIPSYPDHVDGDY